MSVRLQEILVGFGKRKQTNISTAVIQADVWRLNKLNPDFISAKLVTEDDKDEFGKGHEFATAVTKSHWDITGKLEKYASSQFAAWAFAFGLGAVSKSGAGDPYTYTCTPLDPVAGGIELPYFSIIEQIRPGGGAVVDRMAVGCAVESVSLQVASGPGRDKSKITVEFVGSGKLVEPSTIDLPLKTVEDELPGASLTATINGEDYVTAKNLVSLELGFKNNLMLDAGFYPGSGFQTPGDGSTGAIRGRMEYGRREAWLRFVARFASGSTELSDLIAQTTGTAVIGLSANPNDTLMATFHRVSFSAVEIGETDGLVTVAVECSPQYHSSNGLMTVAVETNDANICQAPA